MKLIGIAIGAALLTGAPLSMHCAPKKAGLYVDTADARVIHRRRPSYGYYGVPDYGPPVYPGLFAYGYPAPYSTYGVAPYPFSPNPPTGGFVAPISNSGKM
jgi:hypothetical protein